MKPALRMNGGESDPPRKKDYYTRLLHKKSQYIVVYVKVNFLLFFMSWSQTRSMPMWPLILTNTNRG